MVKLHKLSTAEKMDLVDELWDSVLEEQDHIEITEAQRAELNKRLDKYELDKDGGDSWEIVRARVSNK